MRSFIAILVICGASSLFAFIIAAFSINKTIINAVLVYCFVCFVMAQGLASYKRVGGALFFAVLPAPGLLAALYSAVYFQNEIYPRFQMEKPEFTAACKTAVATFLTSPSSPPSSLAYDWSGEHKPETGPYVLGKFGRIGQMGGDGGRSLEFENSIKFTQIKRYSDYGLKVTGPKYKLVDGYSGDSIYTSSSHKYVDELTADILVYIKISPEGELDKNKTLQGTAIYDVQITDRRDNKIISTMRYVVNQQDKRICGPMNNGTLSLYEFITESLGYRIQR
jgi:hypothetical protein